jgi:hypothetical protein
VLTAAGGLVLLAGEPRATSNVAIVAVVYLGALLWRCGHRREVLLAVGTAAAVAVAVGAVQLLPGLQFHRSSQRSSIDYEFFTASSLRWQLLPVQFLPYVYGGFKALHLVPSYGAATSRLPEITGYVGLFALVALLTMPFWRLMRHRRLGVWTTLVVLGVLLAMGGHTPLGRVLHQLPFYGNQRLQSRNIGITDLGLSGILACWTDALITTTRALTTRVRAVVERALSLVPSLVVIGLVVVIQVWEGGMERFVPLLPDKEGLFDNLRWYYVTGVAVAVAVAVFAVCHRALTPRLRAGLLVLILFVDLTVALVNEDLGPVPRRALNSSLPETAHLVQMLGDGARFALYDPDSRVAVTPSVLAQALSPDLTILRGLVTVQGYSSVVDSRYDDVTDSHARRRFAPSALADATADELNLKILLVPPSYLTVSADPSDDNPVDRDLRRALRPPRWVPAGKYGPYLVFRNTQALGRSWLAGAGSTGPSPTTDTGAVVVVQRDEQDRETTRVTSATAAVLVRDVAWSKGWAATVRTSSGAVRTQSVRRHGVVQAVSVPAGTVTVTWAYHAPGVRVGLVLTIMGVLLLAVVLAVDTVRRRRVARAARMTRGSGPERAHQPRPVEAAQARRRGHA